MASYELTGSVSEKEKHFIETWENVAPGVNYIIRENRRGDEVHYEVKGRVQFKLSSYDRMLTEDQIHDLRHNPFKNGCFRPVIVPENVSVDSNPNAMSEEDIKRVFTCSDEAWDAYMDVIDSPATLQRMLDMADEGTSEIAHRRYQQLFSMHSRFSNVGKRITSSNDPKIQEQMDKMDGSGNEPVSQPARRPGRPKAVSP